MRYIKLLVAIWATVSISIHASAQSDHVPGELIVMLKHGQTADQFVEGFNAEYPMASLRVKKTLSERIRIYLVEFDGNTLADEQALYGALRQSSVEVAQYNHTTIVHRGDSNDPNYTNGDQWGMHNTGQSGGTIDADIDAPEAWDISTGGLTVNGDTIVVAVIDGGFDLNHEDIDFWKNWGEIPNNNIDDDNNGYIDDFDGWNAYSSNGDASGGSQNHGTHVAGTVGAIGNNDIGVVGVSWNVKVMPIPGSSGQESTVVEAYGYALEQRAAYNESNGSKGAYVVSTNSSFGVDFGDPADYPIWCNFYDSLGAVGILSCGATINNHQDVDAIGDIPTACTSDYMIAVTNTDRDDEKAFAGYGITTIDLGAPGSDIMSTLPNNQYGELSGTSMATPHVSGAIGLMYSAACESLLEEYSNDPAGLALIMRNILLDGTDPVTGLTLLTVTEGRLNIYNALQALDDYPCGVTPTAVATDETCGQCNGIANVDAVGGEPPYSFQWDAAAGAQTGMQATGLCAGTYEVTATDALGEQAVIIVAIESDSGPGVSVNTSETSCYGESDGSANVNITSGNPPFSFEWADNNTGTFGNNLPIGDHYVTVTDANGCVTIAQFEIDQPNQIGINGVVTDEGWQGNNGSIAIGISGQFGPFNFLWNTGATTQHISGLTGGVYSITVVDANGCVNAADFTVGSSVGLEDQAATSQMRIYPNPTSGAFQIELGAAGISEVAILNSLGEVVHQYRNSGLATIAVAGLPAGVYFVRFRTENSTETRQLIIR